MGFFAGIPRPFQKESVDNYHGVLVPLSQAKRHESVEAEYARRFSHDGARPGSASGSKKKDSDDDGAAAPGGKGDEETGRGAPAGAIWDGAYTVEMLREEVTNDVAASGHDTAYDCEFYFWGLIFRNPLREEREG